MINVPSRMSEILVKAPGLQSCVDGSLATFEPFLKDNKLPFFPEYTDHGPDHLEGVLRTAAALIRDEAWDVLSPGDAATLILACLLHDLGMHLTEDGFVSLVMPGVNWCIVPELGDKTWSVLWEDFKAEAKRFDERTLRRLYGSVAPVPIPDLEPRFWTYDQRKLIGEFVRRHHHRLAHQMALNGVPGPSADRLELQSCPSYLADLVGLVARSHGMSLRECIPYLEQQYYGKREHKGIHAVFLMAVLRVADYLQVEAERAPGQVLKVRQLHSPLSLREWHAHQAVEDVRPGDDAESLEVIAQPKDVETYLRLKELLAGIQAELDTSWAVLGEVYSRYVSEKYDQLGLTLRRTTSNLDDEKSFAKTVTYVPCRVAFETAGGELMKLLVVPLYGDDPAIGIRELLQNAVDAVRELEALLEMRHELQSIPRLEQEADVVITLKQEEDNSFWLIVSDRGIGMTADTVRNYFLKAGATLRTDSAWRKTFEDETGHSRVLRSGRFGIGIFATFLLGDRIHVSTRHVESQDGLEFEASLEDETVELRKTACIRIGTIVKVRLSEKTASRLLRDTNAWDWYVLERPFVRRIIAVKEDSLPFDCVDVQYRDGRHVQFKSTRTHLGVLDQRLSVPGLSGLPLPYGWHRIQHQEFQDIQWTYQHHIRLSCNGIIIGYHESYAINDGATFFSEHQVEEALNRDIPRNLRFGLPTVSCFDPDNNLPVNLQRNDLSRVYPFMDELRQSILEDFFANALVMGPTQPIYDRLTLGQYLHDYPPHSWRKHSFQRFVPTPLGLTLSDPWLVAQCLDSSVTVVALAPGQLLPNLDVILSQRPVVLQYKDTVSEHQSGGLLLKLVRELLFLQGAVILIPEEDYGAYEDIEWDDYTQLRGRNGWIRILFGQYPEGNDLEQLILTHRPEGYTEGGIVVVKGIMDKEAARPSLVSDLWMEIMGMPAIPYDPVERKAKLVPAYERLKDYIEGWEACRAKQVDAKKTDGKV